MPARKRPAPEDTVTARQILLDGLARDAGISGLVSELAPLHWWQADDFWQYGLFAAVGFIRGAASRAAWRACRCVRHARTWPGALATQRSNDQFRRLWKRSPDGGAADHDGGCCPARLQWWSDWPRGCTTMAGHRRLWPRVG